MEITGNILDEIKVSFYGIYETELNTGSNGSYLIVKTENFGSVSIEKLCKIKEKVFAKDLTISFNNKGLIYTFKIN